MATRKPTKTRALPDAQLRPGQIPMALQRLDALIQEVAAFDTSMLTKRYSDEQEALSVRIAYEIAAIFGDTVQGKRFGNAQKLDYPLIQFPLAGSVAEIRQDVENAKGKSLEILQEAVAWVQRQSASRP